jgi:hypothetical protein
MNFLFLANEMNLYFLRQLEAVVVRDRSENVVRLLVKDWLVINAFDFSLKVGRCIQSQVIPQPYTFSFLIHVAFQQGLAKVDKHACVALEQVFDLVQG